MAKTTTTSKQNKKQTTSDCHCNETKVSTKSKTPTKPSKACDCSDCK